MSILFTTEELKQIEPHPYEYVQTKTKFLEQLTSLNYTKTNQLPFVSVAKAQHRQLMDKVKLIQYEERKQLQTHQFNTIFEESEKPKVESQNLRESYFQEFILQPQKEEISKKQQEKNRYLHICGVVNANNKFDKQEYKQHLNELKELQKEIEKISQKSAKPFYSTKEICRNPKMINKLATPMLNMYNVYFKEIFDALIDDILLEEIEYLNEKQQSIVQQPQEVDDVEQQEEDKEQINEDVRDLLKELGNIIEEY